MPDAAATTPAPADARARFADAQGQLQAATALLSDPNVPVPLGVEHLQAAWVALAGAAAAVAEADADAQPPVSTLREHAPAWLTPTATEAAKALPLNAAAATPTDRPKWLGHARALATAVRAAERQLFGAVRAAEIRRRWWRRIALATAAVAPLVAWTIAFPPEFREGPWHGQYYDNLDFEGQPRIRRDGDIKFKWSDTPPMSGMPDDGFTVRWDTCMTLEESIDLRVKIVSDDGARMFIDGEQLVDSWGHRGERAKGGRKQVEAGVHHVRVEFMERNGSASITLIASLYGERPDSLPTRILTYPGEDFDPDDPCGHLR